MDQNQIDRIGRLKALLEIDPDDPTGWFMLGKLYLDDGQFLEGASAFQRSLELKPDYSAAWKFCGDCWRNAGDTARAREVYEKGIAVADERGDLQTVKEMQAFLKRLDK